MAAFGLTTPQRTTRTTRHTTKRMWMRPAGAGVVLALCMVAAACTANPDPDPSSEQLGSFDGQSNVAIRPPDRPSAPTTVPTATKVPTETTVPTKVTAPGEPLPAETFQQAATKATIAGCEVFPPDHYMNATNIDRLPVHPKSETWMNSLGGPGTALRLANSRVWEGTRSGMPINIVDSRVVGFSPIQVNLNWTSKAYQGGYPVPPNPMVEGHPGVWTDQHMIMLDVADCTVYETIGYEPLMFQWFGIHTALSGAKYRLDTTEMPLLTTNAPETPMVGQYVMRHEVAEGLVPHVLSFCSNNFSKSHIWPARASDGPIVGSHVMPMGAWIRLSADVDLSTFHGDARPVAEALRRHGALLTDFCGHPFRLRMENSATWNDAEMDQLRELRVEDFEVVDSTPLIVDPNTYEIR